MLNIHSKIFTKVNLNSVSQQLGIRCHVFYATNNFLTFLEGICKLFSETNWKYQAISINYSNSFRVKISKWDVTYACLKHLKTSWIYGKFVQCSSYFLLLFSNFVQLLQSPCIWYICFFHHLTQLNSTLNKECHRHVKRGSCVSNYVISSHTHSVSVLYNFSSTTHTYFH